MADPLSVAASVVGLITAAAAVSQMLTGVISKAKHAPVECRRIRDEVDDLRSVLAQLQLFIVGTSRASAARTSLIMVDQVVATLASCVTTFSDLDVFAEALQNDSRMGLLDRLRWGSKEAEMRAILNRVETHKTSLLLMLNILTCQKQTEAEDKVDRLYDMVQLILQQNVMIVQRLAAFDTKQLDTYNVTVRPASPVKVPAVDNTTTKPSTTTSIPNNSSGAIDPVVDSPRVSTDSNRPAVHRDLRGFAFEELLLSSRAYRNAANNNSDAFSVVSSAGRTATWSMLLGLSLSEMSNIAILAIPVYATDINNKEAYDFEPARKEPIVTISETSVPKSPSQSEKDAKSAKQWWRRLRDKNTGVAEASTEVENQASIFGVSLYTSIRYANVAISLLDEKGESYIYGYIPIIVAKIGVYLKEKGTDVEEIFAKSNNAKNLLYLQKVFDTPPRY